MITASDISGLVTRIDHMTPVHQVGRVLQVSAGLIRIAGLDQVACIGDIITITRKNLPDLFGEIVQLQDNVLTALPETAPDGVALADRVMISRHAEIAPSDRWIGRVIDPWGNPLDGKPLSLGAKSRELRANPPPAAKRRALGPRLNTGMTITNTFLPVASGQRIGLFAGSGVGKSSLLGQFARYMSADVIVIGLIGERGRELRHFLDDILGVEGQKRTVVVTATSDQSALSRRRCAWTAMAVAEHFRDQGKSVLLLADSITRFAEAHREVAVAAGEAPVLRGYPPSTAHQIMRLCERAGPGMGSQGDITAIFTVLVAGSDMDEPIADILRGALDGHIVLDRDIAERGRYPAIDVLRSVSRSLPAAATDAENEILRQARRLIANYDRNAMMIRAGLYTQGSDPEVDRAIALWPEMEAYLTRIDPQNCESSFQKLALIMRRG
jgi:flagellum-specific ATP synthase